MHEYYIYVIYFCLTSEEEDEELMPSFNIYMQILISQALEPGFLAAINEERGQYSPSVTIINFTLNLAPRYWFIPRGSSGDSYLKHSWFIHLLISAQFNQY